MLLKNLMKVLGILKLEDLNKDVCKRFGEVIKDDEWLENNFEYIKKTFRIRTKKYDNKEYYQIYLLMITIMKQLFGSGIVKKMNIYLFRKEYQYFYYNNIYNLTNNIEFL